MSNRCHATSKSSSVDDDSTTDEELAKLTIDELRELLDRRKAEEKQVANDMERTMGSRRVITGYIAGVHSVESGVGQSDESPICTMDGSQPPVKMRIQVTADEGEISGKIVSIRKPHKVNTNVIKARKNFSRLRSSEEQVKWLRSQEIRRRKVEKKKERTKGERELRYVMRDAQRKATEIMKDWSISNLQEKIQQDKEQIPSTKLLGNPSAISLFDTRDKIAEDLCVNMLQNWKCEPVVRCSQEFHSSTKISSTTNSSLSKNISISSEDTVIDSGTVSPDLIDDDTCWVYGDELCENSSGLPIDMQSFFVSSPEGGVELMDDRTLMQSVSLDFLHDLLPDEGNNGQDIHKKELEVWISQTDLKCMDDLDDIQIIAVVPSKDYPNNLKMNDFNSDTHQALKLISPLCEPFPDETNDIHLDYDSDFPFGTGTDDEMYADMDAVLVNNAESPSCILTSCCSSEKLPCPIVSHAAPLLSRLSIEEAVSESGDITIGLPVCDDYQLAVENFLDLPAAESMLEDLGCHVMDGLLDVIDKT